MSPRLSRRDTVLLTLYAAVWTIMFLVRAAGALHPLAQPVAVTRTGPDAYPVVRQMLRPAFDQKTALQVGDEVRRVGDVDLRVAGQLRTLLAFAGEGTGPTRAVPVQIVRAGVTRVVREPMPLRPPSRLAGDLAIAIINASIALLILLRARSSPASRAMTQSLAIDALIFLSPADAGAVLYAGMVGIGVILVLLSAPTLIRAAMAFPEEAHGRDGAWRWLPLPFAVVGIPVFSAYYGTPLDPATGIRWSRILVLTASLCFVLLLTRNYWRSGLKGRRQVKWLMLAVYVATLLNMLNALLTDVSAMDLPVWSVVLTVLVKSVFPVGVLIASLRLDLLDINRIFGATVLYNVLAAVALAAGFLVVPRTADLLTAGLDIGRPVAQVVLTLVLAALVLLAGRLLRGRVERRFFGERFALEQSMRDLPERFASVRRAAELWELTGEELSRILRPVSCVIFTRANESFVPVFTDTDSLPPLLPADDQVLAWTNSLSGAHRLARRDREQLGALGTAVVDELLTQVVVPVHRKQTLEAVICLGEKRSGDIYTSTDEALLASIGKTLSSHMLRFDEAELLDRAQTIQQRMQRYVPGALADVIAAGAELETGEREVSVLFVDIRGYTAYADERDVSTVFSTVNRYTEAVSSIVRELGGVVVEFNGDGMMALFGAPRPLPDKEAAAVTAGRRLVHEVPRLAAPESPLFVGVGIATGPAFVGNIEAVDRMIWSAIGSTTNLAARLQAHTRVVGASMVIDEPSWTRAAAARDGFHALGAVSLRGRASADALYALTPTDGPMPPEMTPYPPMRVPNTAARAAPR